MTVAETIRKGVFLRFYGHEFGQETCAKILAAIESTAYPVGKYPTFCQATQGATAVKPRGSTCWQREETRMRAAWLTDIHLDFLSESACAAFFETVAAQRPDEVFLTGDISVAPSLLAHLRGIADAIKTPIYFVLGNHDFYHGSIATVRAAVSDCCRAHPLLRYLPEAGVVPLTESTALVGHDGWGDSRYGDYARSSVRLNDHVLIKELTGLTHSNLQARLRHLGDEAAGYLQETLPKALDQFRRVIVLTHVPPFKGACWYQGRVGNDEWLPFFACGAVGDVLRDLMEKRPEHQLDVYCGHTHNPGTAHILPNLRVFTGEANYGAPQINQVIDID